uniref:Addiction module toxin component, YafQ family/addiction module toxin, RelE/StbE family n=1 Tax=Candidatus Kentrum sp. FW TaxID=2126338 RepID=A0A450TA32_9GAMM|nr:MAG: addiction module toxin component, YafQ family/addiction module toxin, RelE/StbE family [Candidatus Kentron sp. FW]
MICFGSLGFELYAGLYEAVREGSRSLPASWQNPDKFKIIARSLIGGEPLDAIYRDHRLVGNFIGRRECHIESDWLLVYRIEGDRMVFERMGTHSDLFRK